VVSGRIMLELSVKTYEDTTPVDHGKDERSKEKAYKTLPDLQYAPITCKARCYKILYGKDRSK
jgi:hypothetical protein